MSEQSEHITDPKEKEELLKSILIQLKDIEKRYQPSDHLKKIDDMGDIEPCEVSEELCSFISDARENIIKRHITNHFKNSSNTIVITIPKEKYNLLINAIEKIDPTFHEKIKHFFCYPDKQKENINEYLSTKFIEILDKLQAFSTFLSLFKKDS